MQRHPIKAGCSLRGPLGFPFGSSPPLWGRGRMAGAKAPAIFRGPLPFAFLLLEKSHAFFRAHLPRLLTALAACVRGYTASAPLCLGRATRRSMRPRRGAFQIAPSTTADRRLGANDLATFPSVVATSTEHHATNTQKSNCKP